MALARFANTNRWAAPNELVLSSLLRTRFARHARFFYEFLNVYVFSAFSLSNIAETCESSASRCNSKTIVCAIRLYETYKSVGDFDGSGVITPHRLGSYIRKPLGSDRNNVNIFKKINLIPAKTPPKHSRFARQNSTLLTNICHTGKVLSIKKCIRKSAHRFLFIIIIIYLSPQ